MKYTEPIDFPGMESIKENIDLYKKKFLDDSIIVFRNANLTYDEQSSFHYELSKLFNYNVLFIENNKLDNYVENHSKRTSIGTAQKDDILLPWHVEHSYYKNPIVISTWNMVKFTTDSENGKTYFLDCEYAYNAMSEEWQNFLTRCKINIVSNKIKYNFNDYCPVSKHWVTEKPVIRMPIINDSSKITALISVDDKKPTESEEKLFEEICNWFGNYVYTNEEEKITHKWQQGDLLVVDIFKLAHAVGGGFTPQDREFIGMWGYKDPVNPNDNENNFNTK